MIVTVFSRHASSLLLAPGAGAWGFTYVLGHWSVFYCTQGPGYHNLGLVALDTITSSRHNHAEKRLQNYDLKT